MSGVLRRCWCVRCRGRLVTGRIWRLHGEFSERPPPRVANVMDFFREHLMVYVTPYVFDPAHILRGTLRHTISRLLMARRAIRADHYRVTLGSIDARVRQALDNRADRLLRNADRWAGRGDRSTTVSGDRSTTVSWSLCIRGDLHEAAR
jgi:hypothetical protein